MLKTRTYNVPMEAGTKINGRLKNINDPVAHRNNLGLFTEYGKVLLKNWNKECNYVRIHLRIEYNHEKKSWYFAKESSSH